MKKNYVTIASIFCCILVVFSLWSAYYSITNKKEIKQDVSKLEVSTSTLRSEIRRERFHTKAYTFNMKFTIFKLDVPYKGKTYVCKWKEYENVANRYEAHSTITVLVYDNNRGKIAVGKNMNDLVKSMKPLPLKIYSYAFFFIVVMWIVIAVIASHITFWRSGLSWISCISFVVLFGTGITEYFGLDLSAVAVIAEIVFAISSCLDYKKAMCSSES